MSDLAPGDQVEVTNQYCVYFGQTGVVLDVSEDALGEWVNVFLPDDRSAFTGVTSGPAVTGVMFLSTEVRATGQMQLPIKIEFPNELCERCGRMCHVTEGCRCCDRPEPKPCQHYEQGLNGRCVYCDHEKICHTASSAPRPYSYASYRRRQGKIRRTGERA
jgi:hypothetical protein